VRVSSSSGAEPTFSIAFEWVHFGLLMASPVCDCDPGVTRKVNARLRNRSRFRSRLQKVGAMRDRGAGAKCSRNVNCFRQFLLANTGFERPTSGESRCNKRIAL